MEATDEDARAVDVDGPIEGSAEDLEVGATVGEAIAEDGTAATVDDVVLAQATVGAATALAGAKAFGGSYKPSREPAQDAQVGSSPRICDGTDESGLKPPLVTM